MTRKVTVEGTPTGPSYELSKLSSGKIGILTKTISDRDDLDCAQPGDPVVATSDEVVFLRTGTWSKKNSAGYEWRELLPGERIIIEENGE